MSVHDFIRIVRQHVLLIALVTLVAGAAAYFFSERQSPVHRAVSRVVLTYEDLPSILTNGQNPATAVPPERYAATQAQVARSLAVARRALAAGNGAITPSQLLHDSTVTSDPTSDFLSFTVNASKPQVAERLANAYAAAYVAYSSAARRAPLVDVSNKLRARIARLRRLGTAGSPLYVSLVSRFDQIESLLAVQNPVAQVVHGAATAQQTQPRTTRALAVGVPIGVLLGIVIALLLHVLDGRVRSSADAELALGVPSLGGIPLPPRRARHRVAGLDGKGDVYADAVASVRTNLDLERRTEGSEVILFASVAGRTPGVKTTTVANLGVAFARAGFQVVLVDLDLRQPSLASLFSLDPEPGVTDVLLGHAAEHDALAPVVLESAGKKAATHLEFGGSLRVLPVGTLPANPADVIAAPRLGAVLEQLRTEADLILIDAPPVLAGGDVAALSRHADAVTLITHLGHDRRSDLAEARRRLSAVSATRLGTIAVGRARNGAATESIAAAESRPRRTEGVR